MGNFRGEWKGEGWRPSGGKGWGGVAQRRAGAKGVNRVIGSWDWRI
jgi:hypothetical protein